MNRFQAFVYRQYQDDDDVQILCAAFNQAAGEFVGLFETLNLPVYAGNPLIVGELLDWVGQGLYGIPRPTIPLGAQQVIGPFDTYGFATGPAFASQEEVGSVPYVRASDDVYKRVLTWHHWRGDGRQFTIPWLKRRIARFMYGADGTNFADLGTLGSVSVIPVSPASFKVMIAAAPGSPTAAMALLLRELVLAGLLELPFQYSFSITTGAPPTPGEWGVSGAGWGSGWSA